MNKILSLTVCVLTIAAAAMSVLLFLTKKDFTNRTNKLAESYAKIVKTLDSESGVSNQVTFSPASDTSEESGTLGWQAYKEAAGEDKSYQEFSSRLSKSESLAQKVARQRDDLADSLFEISLSINPDPQEDLIENAETLKTLSSSDEYLQEAAKISSLAVAVKDRSADMIETLKKTSKEINDPINTSLFNERRTSLNEDGEEVAGDFRHKTVLADYEKNITALDNRCEQYGESLKEAVAKINKYNWKTNQRDITNSSKYVEALATLKVDFQGINSRLNEFQSVKEELNIAKVKLEDSELEIKDQTEKINEISKLYKKAINQLAEFGYNVDSADIDIDNLTKTNAISEEAPIDPNLEGEIVLSNPEWEFVVVNLGHDKLKENLELLVARNNQYVARLIVKKVTEKYSVADILPQAKGAEIQVGDRVILPSDVLNAQSESTPAMNFQ